MAYYGRENREVNIVKTSDNRKGKDTDSRAARGMSLRLAMKSGMLDYGGQTSAPHHERMSEQISQYRLIRTKQSGAKILVLRPRQDSSSSPSLAEW